jgi:hypothetical protein
MARCDRVARLRWADFGWYKDALTAYLCKSKCDQAGINAFHKKLYFNDSKPEVCPVTALAVLFFSRDEESARCEFVFPRSDTRRNGNRYLSKIIASKYSTATDTAIFGCDPLGIAWHHFKRGAFTFLAGLTDGCSYVATKMRADQKVADVSRVYTFFGQGQDGVIGRLLSLLPYGEPEFIGCAPVLAGVHVPLNEVVSDWETLDERFKLSVVPKFVQIGGVESACSIGAATSRWPHRCEFGDEKCHPSACSFTKPYPSRIFSDRSSNRSAQRQQSTRTVATRTAR